MPIRIVNTGQGYQVEVSPPDGPTWHSSGPLTATEVLKQLATLGCHSTDITDALDGADPSWAVTHDAEVRARRGGIGESS